MRESVLEDEIEIVVRSNSKVHIRVLFLLTQVLYTSLLLLPEAAEGGTGEIMGFVLEVDEYDKPCWTDTPYDPETDMKYKWICKPNI
jgi:hypothetical protein